MRSPRGNAQHNPSSQHNPGAAAADMNSLLEVDVLLLPVPQVGEVPGIRLGLAGEQRILGDVDRDVLRRGNDKGRSWRGEEESVTPTTTGVPTKVAQAQLHHSVLAGGCWRALGQGWPHFSENHSDPVIPNPFPNLRAD